MGFYFFGKSMTNDLPKIIPIGGLLKFYEGDRYFQKRFKKEIEQLNEFSVPWDKKQEIAHYILKTYFKILDATMDTPYGK